MSDLIGILICGHGSSDVESQQAFAQWVNTIQQRMGLPCAAGFLEAQQPSIHEAAQQLINQGIQTLFAIPALLLAGRHSQKDIPLELSTVEDAVEIIYLAEVIEHPKLLQAAVERIKAVAHGLELANTQVLFIAHGSRNQHANEIVVQLSQQLQQTMGLKDCIATFGQIGSPTLGHTLLDLDPSPSIALPYFLFSGKPFKDIEKQITDFSQRFPDHPVILSRPLGDHPLVLDAFCDTLHQAITQRTSIKHHND